MDIAGFWRLIDAARVTAGGDMHARPGALSEQLRDLSAAELQQFQNHYDEQIRRSFTWELCAAACIINRDVTDDGFRYFRDWLISAGQGTFERALAAPDSLADLPKLEYAGLETFGYVALELYDALEAGELGRDFATDFAEPRGAEWEREELPAMLPRLHAKYPGWDD
jgi:hypothetical protein